MYYTSINQNTEPLYQDNKKMHHSKTTKKQKQIDKTNEMPTSKKNELKYGSLYLISSPIGNLKDITLRAIETLFNVDLLLCEDTRVTSKLLHRYQDVANELIDMSTKYDAPQYTEFETTKAKTPKLLPFHEHNEARLHTQVLENLMQGMNIGLISDAGTPLVSDPGFKLVRECLEQNIRVEAIPGPTAVTTALILSGFPPDKYLYLGYMPRKSSKRKQLLESIQNDHFDHLTVVTFESPYRVVSTIKDILETLGDIEVAVCRELTKLHEEVRRDSASKLIEYYTKKNPKGEIVLVFEIE